VALTLAHGLLFGAWIRGLIVGVFVTLSFVIHAIWKYYW
jgi:hypothetical protein